MQPSRADFLLRKDVTFLNHGSFGACPRVLLDEQRRWIDRMEAQPVQFFREAADLMKGARTALAEYVGADAKDLVFVTNSTYGVSVAAHALAASFSDGDEILMTDHEYGACERAWRVFGEPRGIRIVHAELPVPAPSQEVLADHIWSAVTPRTKVLFLSHITSPTGIRLPADELCRRARAAGILTVIDGSHVPGHIPLDLAALDADVYTANCHKWMCTPKGSAFLWVHPGLQATMRPLVVSWGSLIPTAGDGPFVDDHEYLGTRDLSPFLTLPAALRWMDSAPWTAVQDHGRGLAQRAAHVLSAIAGIRPIVDGWHDPLLQMTAVELPDHVDVMHMKEWLLTERAIEVVVHRWLGRAVLRCSAHAHTTEEDVRLLGDAVRAYLDL
jgi:isopenicillin-N epimerase